MVFNFKSRIAQFLYPPLCLNCSALLKKRIPLLCSCCLDQISLIPPGERCSTCFNFLRKGGCDQCKHRSVVIRRQMAAAEAMGPVNRLLTSMHQGNTEAAKALAALMAYQWLEYKMPLADWVIPLPCFFWQKENPNEWLARCIARTFSVPVLPILQKKWDREKFLTEGIFSSLFDVKKKGVESLCDKKLLLIAAHLDDEQLRAAAALLQPFFPQQIYALAAVCSF